MFYCLHRRLALTKHLYTKSIIKNDRGVNIGGLGWDSEVFESVDWKAIENVQVCRRCAVCGSVSKK